jgi:hypothetical protein
VLGALSDVNAMPVCTSQSDVVFAQLRACTQVHPRLTACMPLSSVCAWPPSSMPHTHAGFPQHCNSAHAHTRSRTPSPCLPPFTSSFTPSPDPPPPMIMPGSRASCSWAWRCASQRAALASSSASQAKPSQNVLSTFAVAVCSKHTRALTLQNFRVFFHQPLLPH